MQICKLCLHIPQTMVLEEIKNKINTFISENNLTQTQIANSTGIHQSQVSRILNGQFKTVSKNIKTLCKYANINIDQTHAQKNLSPQENKDLMEALKYVWDGSTNQAKALAKVIRSLKGL